MSTLENYEKRLQSLKAQCAILAREVPARFVLLGYKNKKDVRLVALRPSICRHRQTPWPNEQWRNNIPTPWYIRGQCAERTPPAYTQNEHWLLRSLVLNFGEFTNRDLKQNAFLHRWIYYMKPLSLGKANGFSLLSFTRGFAPHRHCEDKHFLSNQHSFWNIISSNNI